MPYFNSWTVTLAVVGVLALAGCSTDKSTDPNQHDQTPGMDKNMPGMNGK